VGGSRAADPGCGTRGVRARCTLSCSTPPARAEWCRQLTREESSLAWAADRQRVSSGAPWEPRYGYARAVRVGPFVHVSGTTGVGADGKVVEGGLYAQARRALDIIEAALREAGASLSDVVRTRAYVTDVSQWEELSRAHGERFGSVRPAATLVQVAALIDPAMLVEIEVDAIVGASR
jgi:enamine deaminase RidA (YjgF/YER057c/UK114 family)